MLSMYYFNTTTMFLKYEILYTEVVSNAVSKSSLLGKRLKNIGLVPGYFLPT